MQTAAKEAILLVGVVMVSSIVTSVSIINAGVSETFLAGLPDIQRNTVARQFDSLINAPTPFYLLSIGERLIAIALHITLAMLVWMVVRFTAGGFSARSSPTLGQMQGLLRIKVEW